MSFVAPKSLDNRAKIIDEFLKMYETVEDLKELFDSFFLPNSAIKDLIGIGSKKSKAEVAGILVDYLGMNFFSTAGRNYNAGYMENNNGKYLIREKLLEQACKMHKKPKSRKREILNVLNRALYGNYGNFRDLSRNRQFLSARSKKELMAIFGFPSIVFESPPKLGMEEETTTVGKKPPLKPLYDYQTQAVVKINNMLSEADEEKRILISVPTGAGKTRLTVEALINWINDRDAGKTTNASLQQNNGDVIFWFASTNELCSQAASEFVNMYSQIGEGGSPFNVTRLYGNKRRALPIILNENPGTHVVVTNTEHFQKLLKEERQNGVYQVDQYKDSESFNRLRGRTIAIVIDEAHEALAETYRRFLAAMGFDFSGRKGTRNQNGIVLIGLTATPYRGSGRLDSNSEYMGEFDEFVESDTDKDPPYFKRLDKETRRMHKMFHSVYIPLPEVGHKDPDPVPAIEAPGYAHTGEHVRISGLRSFDNFSELKYDWSITRFGKETAINSEPVFYHKFTHPDSYNIKLTVTNKKGKKQEKIHQIKVYPSKKTRNSLGNLNDNKEFNTILQDRNILCRIIYGVIDGPQLRWDKYEIQRWKKGNMSEENEMIVDNDRKYNEQICDIIDKSINKYGRKRVLVFANGVSHAHNIALILSAKYKLEAKSVDGTMNHGLRRQIIHDFREGKINVLCNHGILTSGFDVPQIDTLLICRTVGSNALYTQMIGRGQRGMVAGGTDNLWLFTAYFKKGEFDDIRLGWEALADTWEKFPDDIKEDLKIQDSEYTATSTNYSGMEQPKPIGDQDELVCQKCNVRAKKKDASKLFLIDNSGRVSGARKYCITCNDLGSIMDGLSCSYSQHLSDYHNYDPILVMIAKFASHAQTHGKAPKFKDLQKWLRETMPAVSAESFEMTSPWMIKAQKLGFMVVKGNLDLVFPSINDPEGLDKVVRCIMDSPSFSDKLSKLTSVPRVEMKQQDPDKLVLVLEELKSGLGHIPTGRQFRNAVSDKGLDGEFAASYGSNYARFLLGQNIILKDDWDLKDSLYGEYFEKCMEEKAKITRSQLDKHGEYRMVDYEEIFGPFASFQSKADRELGKILEHVGEEKHNKNEVDLFDRDLTALREKIGRWPHFDDLRIHSGIGAHKYSLQFRLSHLKYLKKYDGVKPGQFLALVGEYLILEKSLVCVPSKEQFLSLVSPNSRIYLGELFGLDYDRFLRAIDVDPESTRDEPKR